MNEIQTFLAEWLKNSYREINDICLSEANEMGYGTEVLKDENINVVHNVRRATFEGVDEFTYMVKDYDKVVNIITVKFNIRGFEIYSHKRKDIIIY